MTAMGNRFGIHGLEAASTHSERDVSDGRISNVSMPTEVPAVVSETRSDFGSSCPDPEVSQTKSGARYNGAQAVGQETKNVSCCPEVFRTGKQSAESSKYLNILLSPPEFERTNEAGKITTPKGYISILRISRHQNG